MDLSVRRHRLPSARRRTARSMAAAATARSSRSTPDRQGALDPRRHAGHDHARHELLGEQGRQGPAADLQHERLPAGDRRRDRQVDHDLRRPTASSTCARDSAAIRRPIGRIQSGTPGQVFENLIILGSATGEGYMSPPGRSARLRRRHRASWRGSSTPCRIPASSATRRGRRTRGSTSGARTRGARVTIDEKRGIVYFPTGSPTYDFYGADRAGTNLFSDCLIALDARTGKRLWHFQTTHHDLWDYDNNGGAAADDDQAGRQDDRRRRAGRQDRIPVRVRSRDAARRSGRSKSVRCRRATCPAIRAGRRSRFPRRRHRSRNSCSRRTTSARTTT